MLQLRGGGGTAGVKTSSTDGCSHHFSFLKASSLALFPSPQALRSREKSRTRGSPCRMVSMSLRRFLLGGIFLDFFCFAWARLLLLHLHLDFDPGWPLFFATRVELAWTSWSGLDDTLSFDLGGSTPVLRPSVSVAHCLLGCAGGTPVPPLELGYPTLFVRASDASRYASTSVSPFCQGCASWWPGRRLRGHLGVASATRCPSTSAALHRCRALRSRWSVVFWLRRRTPVSPHELGYPTLFVRASNVPLRVVVLVPVFSSLGLVVVLCQW